MKFNYLTVYARKEPSSYPEYANIPNDIQVYKDKSLKIPFVRFSHFNSNKPSKRNKYITLNCFKYKLEWVS